jgi:hypothetical protein
MGSLISLWNTIQSTLLLWLEEELDPLTEKQKHFVSVIELMNPEPFLKQFNWIDNGRKPKKRLNLLKALESWLLPQHSCSGYWFKLKGAGFRAVSGHRKDIYAKNQGKNYKIAHEGHQRPVLRYISILFANVDGGFAIGSNILLLWYIFYNLN